MEAIHLFVNETRLLSRSLLARVFLLLTAALAGLGLKSIEWSNTAVLHTMKLSSVSTSLGSAQYAGLAGAALFAMLTLLSLSRDQRKGCRDLLDASCRHSTVISARIAALLFWVIVTHVAIFLTGWLSHFLISEASFDPLIYSINYLTVSFPAMVISVLICSGLYLATESLDISFITFGALYIIGFFSSNYLLRWVQGSAVAYSDFGGIEPMARYLIYNRLFWTCLTLSTFLIGLLLSRRLGYGLVPSVVRNSKGGLLPALIIITLVSSVFVYHQEPFLFRQDPINLVNLAKVDDVRLQEVESHATLHTPASRMSVEARYVFDKDPQVHYIDFATNAGLVIESVQVNGEPGSWQRIPDTEHIRLAVPDEAEKVEVQFQYAGSIKVPAAGMFSGFICSRSVYLLEASHWLFEPLTVCEDRATAYGSISAPKELTVVTPGRTESVTEVGEMRRWEYWATTPALNLGIFAAEYEVERMRVGQLDVEMYISPRHEATIRKLGYGAEIARILEFYQEFLGPYPFEDWPIKIVEVPLYKPGGHSSLNVVTIGEYLLNRRTPQTPGDEVWFVSHDVKIVGHELAHQWWGTGVDVVAHGSWLSEGLVEYSVYRYLLEHHDEGNGLFVIRSWESAVDRQMNSYFVKHPEELKTMRPEFARNVTTSTIRIDAYNGVPLRLIDQEKRVGVDEFSSRLSAVFRKYSKGRMYYDEFLTDMRLTGEVLHVD